LKHAQGWIAAIALATVILLAGVTAGGARRPHPWQAPAQNQRPAPTPQTSLKADTRLVQLSVLVHDKSGAPVRDLKKEDFVVLDEKKRQTIEIFSMETNLPPTTAPAALPPGTYTNRLASYAGVPNSVTVILLDGLNTPISDQAYARQGVVKFLGQIRPEDHVAVYTLGRDLRILHDFTNDASSLVRAVQQFRGRSTPDLAASSTAAPAGLGPLTSPSELSSLNFLTASETQREAAFYTDNRVAETIAAMKDIANHVSSLPGRKNLIWVSGSFPIAFGFDNSQSNTFFENAKTFENDVADAVRAMNDASVAVYPVDARGLLTASAYSGAQSFGGRANTSIAQQSRSFQDLPVDSHFTMEALAHGTGGQAFYDTNDIFGSIRRAIDDSAVTYSLGYYPADIKWDGKYHEVKVEVQGSSLKVRARKGYFALPEPQMTPELRRFVIAEVARNPLEATGIGVTATVHQVAATRTLKTSVLFDLRNITMQQKDGRYEGAVDVVMLDLNDQNKILDAIDQTYHLHLTPDVYARLLKEGASVTKDLTIAPSAVQLRVVVRDANTGTMGTLRVPMADYFPVKASTN
jgi:VWFA-related protein